MLGVSALSQVPLSAQPSAGFPAVANFAFTGTAHSYSTNFKFGAAATPNLVTGVGAVTIPITAEAVGTHTPPSVTGVGAVTIPITGNAAAAHGVSGVGAATILIAGAAAGAHGVSGVGAATIPITAAAVATHLRFEVRGDVRQGGILVNRRVRVYRRSDGALVSQADTVAGKFNLPTGFAEDEFYVVPVDLSDGAVDWTPPVANRVVSALAQDV